MMFGCKVFVFFRSAIDLFSLSMVDNKYPSVDSKPLAGQSTSVSAHSILHFFVYQKPAEPRSRQPVLVAVPRGPGEADAGHVPRT